MYYPIAIEPGDETHAFGVVVPDLPGCFSAGDTFEEAVINAKEAICSWIETMAYCGHEIPKPTPMRNFAQNYPELKYWIWNLVEIEPISVVS